MAELLAYEFPPYRLVPAQRELFSGPHRLKLGGRAFDLLLALVERRERTVSKQELMDLVWPQLVVEENNLQVQALALRKLLGHAAIATVPGRGYRFTLPVSVTGRGARGAATDIEPDTAAAHPRCNLPHWLPPLYGREAALNALLALMTQHAWVTVVGPAGIGKTRLAQSAARLSLDHTPGGVWWVDLASVADPALVASTVVTAMGLRPDSGADPVQVIAQALSGQPTLIVVDNAEHLLDAVAAFLTRLRPAASQLKLLLTSQQTLHGADEQVFRLEPLSLPDEATAAAAERSGAVTLFTVRARASDRHFELDDQNRAAVVDICRKLDGIPLALELAAARTSLFGVDGLRARLDNRFQVLTSGDRTALRRHRTLREALEWSHQLLSEPERAVFRRLGVFAGGFTLEAAQAVAEDGAGLDGWDVLEHLGSLVDKSLVVAEGDPVPRYRMLETLRLFALERLVEHGEIDSVRKAHCAYCMEAAEAARDLMRASIAAGLRQLDLERDNILLAMSWARAGDDGTVGLRMAVAMRLYWTSRGLVPKGLELMRAALAHPGLRGASRHRCEVQMRAATFSSMLGRHADALHHATCAASLARELGDDALLSSSLAELGVAHLSRNELADAARVGLDALAVARRVGQPGALIYALSRISAVYMHGEQFARARELEDEVLAISQREGDVRNQVVANLNLAVIATETGDLPAVLMHLDAARVLLPAVDSVFLGASFIRVVAGWAAAQGRHGSAISLYAAHAAHCQQAGVAVELERFESARLQDARRALGDANVADAEEAGRAWRYPDALRQAAGLLDAASP